MKLEGTTALITGGSSGIGLALARSMQRRGSRILICGRSEEKLREAQRSVPGLEFLVADVADPEQRRRLHEWVVAEHPETSVLINNAGLQRRASLLDGPEAIQTGELAVNLEAPIHLSSLFLPHLTKSARAGRPTAIVNVTSGLGYVALASTPIYGATKSGLQAYTRALRHQLRGSGVKVVDLSPPAVRTPLLEGAQEPGARGGPPTISPEDFAERAVKALEKGASEVRIGGAQFLYLLGRLAPGFAFRLLNRLAS